MTWEDATNYVKWLAAKTGQPYHLPSEAEWEYAARAGAIDAHYWGDTDKAMCAYANGGGKGCDDGQAKTSAVGGFRPNAFGLYDMLGNVWEWTADCWHDSYDEAPVDGSAWLARGNCGFKGIARR